MRPETEFDFHPVRLAARIVRVRIDEGAGIPLICLDADMLHEFAAAARLYYEQEFSPETVIATQRRVYEQVLATA